MPQGGQGALEKCQGAQEEAWSVRAETGRSAWPRAGRQGKPHFHPNGDRGASGPPCSQGSPGGTPGVSGLKDAQEGRVAL